MEFGRKPPAGLGRDLLGRMIAMRIQEQTFGGLDRDSLTFLDCLARRGALKHRHLKPGTVLGREYQGKRHTVTVGRDGFRYRGPAWASLKGAINRRPGLVPTRKQGSSRRRRSDKVVSIFDGSLPFEATGRAKN